MIAGIFSILDRKAQVFGAPFVSANRLTAQRSFKTLVHDRASVVYGSPEDFALYEVGAWNDNTGKVETQELPELVINAAELV